MEAEEEWLQETSLAATRLTLGAEKWRAAVAAGEQLTMTAALAEAALAGTGDT
jgi:hypothetical protein